VNPLALVGVFLGLTLLGVLLGAVTGLAPGLHVNNVAALLLATRELWAGLVESVVEDARTDPTLVGILLSAFLLATAASHSVVSFVPSVFLGAPTEDTALATLPGHRLLLAGKGAKAVALAARGAVLGTAFAVVLLIPLRFLLDDPILLAERFRPWTAAFLVGLLAVILLSEVRGRGPGRRILRSAWVQALAGLLGIVTLRGAVPIPPNVVLFPLFAGLFGLPTLFASLRGPAGRVPPQTVESLRPLGRQDIGNALRGAAAGAAISWLPGLSGGVAATLASVGRRRRSGPTSFMVVLGAVSSSTSLLSVAVLFMIQRTRSGVAAGVRVLLGDPGGSSTWGPVPGAILPLVVAAVLATALAAPLAAGLARRAARTWSRADPRRISAMSVLVILGLLFVVTGPVGLAVAGVATLVGLVPIAFRVRRIHLMASLLVPVLLTYLLPTS
jgi:putative membrane protein